MHIKQKQEKLKGRTAQIGSIQLSQNSTLTVSATFTTLDGWSYTATHELPTRAQISYDFSLLSFGAQLLVTAPTQPTSNHSIPLQITKAIYDVISEPEIFRMLRIATLRCTVKSCRQNPLQSKPVTQYYEQLLLLARQPASPKTDLARDLFLDASDSFARPHYSLPSTAESMLHLATIILS